MTEDHPDEGTTQEYPTIASGLTLPDDAAGDLSFDEDDEWPVRGPARGIRLALPTAALAVVVLVAAGFWSGAVVQKNHGGSSANAAAAFISRFRSGTGTTGTGTTTTGAPTFGGGGGGGGFGGGAGTSGTSGTVSVVNGNTLYILTSAGALVKVTLGPSTTITRNAKSQAVGLRPGDSVVVQGATSSNGDVAATSVSATAPGVSAAGGFGGGRFGSGGTAGSGGG